jgi:two-component system NtrC family sensor kinase
LLIFVIMFRTINSKFIFFTIIFIMSSVGLPTTFLIRQFRANFEQRTSALLETTMEVVYGDVVNVMLKYEHKRVQDIIDKIMRYKIIRHLRFFNTVGDIRFATDTTEIGRNIDDVEKGHVQIGKIDHKVILLLENKKVYTSTRPIENLPECKSCHGLNQVIGYLDVDVNLTRAERYFYTGSYHIIFLAIAMVLLLFFGFYFLFSHFIRKPLDRLTMALNQVEKGQMDTRLPAKKEDEIGILERQFNTMVANLQASKQKIEELHFEQLQRADKLVTLGELAAEMAHEINNPAGIVMSRADYLHLKADENIALQKYQDDLQVIINQVNKISRITGNILKYSKKLPKQFHTLDLQQVLEESLNVLEPRLAIKRINLHKEFKDDDCQISGDAQQLEQVFTNLINNALDAMSQGGVLTLTLNRTEQNQIQIKISDTGAGIPSDLLDQIFTPFYTTKAPDKGTGLGLYIVKNICKNHNADIQCTSTPGQGTTFTITFRGNELKK